MLVRADEKEHRRFGERYQGGVLQQKKSWRAMDHLASHPLGSTEWSHCRALWSVIKVNSAPNK